MKNRQPFLTHCFSLVICKSNDNRWLCIKETRNRGWWVPGGIVEPKESFLNAAIRETKLESGIDVEIKGILRIEHSIYGHQTARLRVIFFATSDFLETKQISDEISECAAWLTIKDIISISKSKPGIRGPEILEWPTYIENGGLIAPLSFLGDESEKIEINTFLEQQQITLSNKLSTFTQYDLIKLFKLALENEDLNHIKELLISGVDFNQPINQKNWSALHYSIKIKNEDIVRVLLISGAKTDLKTTKNRNCFHFAAQSTFTIIQMLGLSLQGLDYSTQQNIINSKDVFGDTPLHIASKDIYLKKLDSINNLKFLINLGGDLELKNEEGYSPNDYLGMIN